MWYLDWLHDLLYESRQKWKELKDWKSYLSVFQLGLAEGLRWLSLLCLFLGLSFVGLGESGMLASESFVEVRAWKFSNGRVYVERRDGCANLVWIIFFALALLGVGLLLAHCLIYLLAIMFWGLSFVYCFQTELEFEFKYSNKINKQNTKINLIQSLVPEAPNDAAYMAAFNEKNDKDIAAARGKIVDLEIQREKEREKRRKASTDNCCNSAEAVPVEEPNNVEAAEEFEETLRGGIENYVLMVETAAVEAHVNELALAEQQALPDKIDRLMESEKMSREEVLKHLRRTIYSDFNEDLNEVRLSVRRDARIRIRVSVNRTIKNEAQPEDMELIDQLKNLSFGA